MKRYQCNKKEKNSISCETQIIQTPLDRGYTKNVEYFDLHYNLKTNTFKNSSNANSNCYYGSSCSCVNGSNCIIDIFYTKH